MSIESDVVVADGRTLHVYDSGPVDGAQDPTTLVWQTGSPQTGALLAPVLEACAVRGLRLVSYARPGYGRLDADGLIVAVSTRQPGRTVADAAADVHAVVDSLGVGRFIAMGASGGGPHSLAAAALLGDRVTAAVTLAGVAPYRGDGSGGGAGGPGSAGAGTSEGTWFDGMQAPQGLLAAREGRQARERFAEVDEFDPESFIAADFAALDAEWSVLGVDSMAASAAGSDGLIDDDLAFAADWGFDVGSVRCPVLVVQGGLDRVIPAQHGRWLLDLCGTELWLRPRDGHVSILRALPLALDWARAR